MVLALVVVFCTSRAVLAGEVVAWGSNDYGQCTVPEPNEGFVVVAGSIWHSLGVKADGSIMAWGRNNYGQCNVPEPNEGFIAVAAGYGHSLGLKADGSITAWEWNEHGQCDVPSPNSGFIAVAAGSSHSLGLKADGSIAAWGLNSHGECNVPLPNEDFVAVASGNFHSLGLKADGSIVAWGNNGNGQCNVPEPNEGFVAVAAGGSHSLGVKANGSIVAWGLSPQGQCTVPSPNSSFVAVAAGSYYSLGLKADGSIVAWGSNSTGECDVPLPNEGFVAVAAGYRHSLGLKKSVRATSPNPADSTVGVDVDADLSWTAGYAATSHDVYFGTSSPGSFQGNQTETTYEPGTMNYSTTYYWRIDELYAGGTTTGAVWSFSTEALVYCPSADLTGDCFVDLEDLVIMVNQWLTTDPCVPDDMAYIRYGGFEMGDHFAEGISSELPLHAVLLDSFLMGKYEVTNRQYCDFLNSAEDGNEIKVDGGIVYASSDDSNSYPYCETSTTSSYSQIDYNDISGTFSVRTKGQTTRDMSNDPMVLVSWYGAAAYCNWRSSEEEYQQCYDINDPNWECDFSKKGYRLPTEAEWEYAARGGNPYYRFPWGDTINHDYANYAANGSAYNYDTSPYTTYTFHPDWNDGIYPYTSPAGSFSANCFRLFDMAGNLWQWCNDWYNSTYYSTSPYDNPQGPVNGTFRVLRGGSWKYDASHCRVALRCSSYPIGREDIFGFRVVRDFDLADCPSADLTGDCFVDFEDFALITNQWLISDPCGLDDMAYIPYGGFEMGNHFAEGFSTELPLHAVLLDSFYLGKYEITNRQYCDFLNSAEDGGEIKVDGGIVYASSDAGNSYPYCDTSTSRSYSQIVYSGGVFSVRTKPEVGGRDMSNDPMVQVSWYGSAAYCNWRSEQEGNETCYNLSTWDCDFSKKGYRLPTEAEWEYAARGGSPYYRFPWGDTITHSQANYCSYWEEGSPLYSYDLSPTEGFHPDCNDGIYPYTSVISSFFANGFGLYDMAGNVFEWCNDWHNSTYYYTTSPYVNPQGPVSGTYRVLRGGSWADNPWRCRSAARFGYWPDGRGYHYGFRIVRDLE